MLPWHREPDSPLRRLFRENQGAGGLCLEYVDPATLGSWMVVFGKRDWALWRQVVERWVRGCLVKQQKWVESLSKVRLGAPGKVALEAALGKYLREAGLKVFPWDLRGNPDFDRLQGRCAFFSAGSHPLHTYMSTTAEPNWTPGDVDIYAAFSGSHNYNLIFKQSSFRVYRYAISVWITRFERDVLKDSATTELRKPHSYPEHIMSTLEEDRADVNDHESPHYSQDNPESVRANVQLRRVALGVSIFQIRDFKVDASYLKDKTEDPHVGTMTTLAELKLPLFSFIHWRDLRTPTPTLDRLLQSFDIDVCQVGMELRKNNDSHLAEAPSFVSADGDIIDIRPLNDAVAHNIRQRTAHVIIPYPVQTLLRFKKYSQRGFTFPPETISMVTKEGIGFVQ